LPTTRIPRDGQGLTRRTIQIVRTRSGVVTSLIAVAAVLAACSPTPTGTVVGVFEGRGNPAHQGYALPSSGTLSLTGDGRTYRAMAGQNGRFSITLPTGTYCIFGRRPRETGGETYCEATVHVRAGQVARAVVRGVFH
jgi:hypothetical protein